MRVARSDEWECELQEFLFHYRRRLATQRLARRFIRRSPVMWLRYTALLIAVLVILKVSLVEAFFVPTSSMAPAIQPHDYILVPKFLYGLHLPLTDRPVVEWGSPARGDVVVFKPTDVSGSDASRTPTMVKRVIALEGDTVEIVEGQVYLNSVPLFEPYARGALSAPEGYRFGPYKVPVGKIFVLGDNRANSEDSRFWSDPFVPVSQVLGRAVVVYWSSSQRDRSGTVL